MVIDHIGIVVSSIPNAITMWNNQFEYSQYTDIVENTRQKVKVAFLSKPGSLLVKLIEPTDESSPIFLFAKRGGGLHHLCFMCADMTTGIDALKLSGARLLVPPQPGEAFNNNDISFLLTGGNLNIELIDTLEKAHILTP